MPFQRISIGIGLGLMVAQGIAACAPPAGLPQGGTPIPTLIPATEVAQSVERSASPSFAILSYPARPPSAIEGQRIYDANCARCHGEDGTGAVPAARNFRDLDYVRGESPANFYAAVTEGRGEMPTYGDSLSSDQRWDVVFYVWRLSTSADLIEAGREIYDQNCAACHGLDGSGELLGSADFTDLRQMDQLAPRDLYLTVTQGRGSMPSWQSRLSQEERWAVIDYVRAFTYDASLPEEVSSAAAPPTVAAGQLPAQACSEDQKPPFDWDDGQAIEAGKAIFQQQCAICHGSDGSGGLPNTPDFTSPQTNADLQADPGRYYCSATEGAGAMPAFEKTLSEQERWQVLLYLGSLGP